MFRTVKNAAASLALAGLVLSQPAMAVRSSDSLPSATHLDSRVGTPMGRFQNVAGHPSYGYIIAGLIVIGVIIIIASDHNHNKSPG